MENISDLKVGDKIAWKSKSKDGRFVVGTITERVSSKKRPLFQGKCTNGYPCKKCVSYIVTDKSRHKHWILETEIVKKIIKPERRKEVAKSSTPEHKPQQTGTQVKTRTDNSNVKILSGKEPVRIGIPDEFRRSLDSKIGFLRSHISL